MNPTWIPSMPVIPTGPSHPSFVSSPPGGRLHPFPPPHPSVPPSVLHSSTDSAPRIPMAKKGKENYSWPSGRAPGCRREIQNPDNFYRGKGGEDAHKRVCRGTEYWGWREFGSCTVSVHSGTGEQARELGRHAQGQRASSGSALTWRPSGFSNWPSARFCPGSPVASSLSLPSSSPESLSFSKN